MQYLKVLALTPVWTFVCTAGHQRARDSCVFLPGSRPLRTLLHLATAECWQLLLLGACLHPCLPWRPGRHSGRRRQRGVHYHWMTTSALLGAITGQYVLRHWLYLMSLPAPAYDQKWTKNLASTVAPRKSSQPQMTFLPQKQSLAFVFYDSFSGFSHVMRFQTVFSINMNWLIACPL